MRDCRGSRQSNVDGMCKARKFGDSPDRTNIGDGRRELPNWAFYDDFSRITITFSICSSYPYLIRSFLPHRHHHNSSTFFSVAVSDDS
jgi:hypothetical protein